MNKILILFFVWMIFPGLIIAQEYLENAEVSHDLLHHRVAAGFGYTYVPKAEKEPDGKKGVLVPTLSVEYFYKFSHTWSLGLMLDLELIDYVIPFHEDDLSRHNALIIGAVGIYEPLEYWGIFAGLGVEIEQHHNFEVVRAGSAYEFQIGNHWDISPSIIFDFKEEYTAWALMVSAGKHF